MASVFHRLRQPEYTGENRCLPCTVVNLFIAFLLALGVLLAAVAAEADDLALLASMAVFGLCGLAIYFRGYLVPGTPELTKRYFPPWLLALFGKRAEGAEGLTGADEGGERTISDVDPEQVLLESGTLVPCDDVDDLCLEDSFATAWQESIRETRESGTDRERLFAVLDAEDLDPRFEERGRAFWALEGSRRIGSWESRAAFHADVAAAPLLADRVEVWDELSVPARGGLLNGLRLFLETCPECDADLAFQTETVESCCSSHEVAALSCDACGARLFESDPL